jgi:DNA-binding NarL/FixJ family response regulator
VLIDPREERRAITSGLVERCPALTVVGLAASLAEDEAQIRVEQADVAIVEIQMPVAHGLATIRALRDQFRELRIIVCSFRDDSATREAARMQGADGYLPKPLQVVDILALVVDPARSPTDGDHTDPGTSAVPTPAVLGTPW